jgi:trigger factor
MQVSVNTTGPLERQLTIQVPEDQIVGEVKNRLKSISRSARIDGFRPGKAPFTLIERRFAGQVRQEVVGEVLNKTFVEAVNQEKLRPAGQPVIDPVSAEPGQGLSYTATFEIYPEVKLAPMAELKVQTPVCEISDADVDKMVETLRQQRRGWETVERAAETGDRITMDFKGSINGEEFAGGGAEDFDIELGAGRFIPDLENGLIGKAVGDHEIEVSFPDDYHGKELAGKKAVFAVKIKAVAAPVLPELNDEFFKLFGVTEGGFEGFRAEVRRNVERERDNAVRNLTKQNVLDALHAANPVDLPKALVASEAERLLQETQRNLAMQGMPHDQLEAMQAEGFLPQAERRVALGLIMGEVIKSHDIKVDGGKVRAAVDGIAANYDDPAAVVKWYYEDPKRLGDIEMSVLEDAAVERLVEQAAVEALPVAFDDLMKPRQTV